MDVGRSFVAKEGAAYLAYKDQDTNEGWEAVTRAKADPEPLFLVWAGKGRTIETSYPWPWGVAALDLVRFDESCAGTRTRR